MSSGFAFHTSELPRAYSFEVPVLPLQPLDALLVKSGLAMSDVISTGLLSVAFLPPAARIVARLTRKFISVSYF